MIVTSKYYWQTIFVLTLVNSPPKSQVSKERKIGAWSVGTQEHKR